MIQLFEEEASGLLARVEAAVRSSDAEQLRIAAHSLRGMVSSFSTSAAKAAQILEQLGIEGRAGEAAGQYQVLNQAVQELRTILPALTIEKLPRLSSEHAPSGNLERQEAWTHARQQIAQRFASRLFTFHWLIAPHARLFEPEPIPFLVIHYGTRLCLGLSSKAYPTF